MTRLLLAAALVAPSLALAVPLQLTQQGRLFDSAAGPLDGQHSLTLSLHDAPSGGGQLWLETQQVEFDNGYYAVQLGADGANPLSTDIFDGNVWVQLAVDTGPGLERQPVNAVPFAIQAEQAKNVSGGIVDAAEIRVNGLVVIDEDGTFLGEYVDTLAGLSCADGQVAAWSSSASAWSCADAVDADGVAALLAGGPMELAEGTTVGGVALSTLTASDAISAVEGAPVSLASGSTIGGSVIAGISDITWSNLANTPAVLADGQVGWSELQGVPSGFLDGTDDERSDAEIRAAVSGSAIALAGGSSVDGGATVGADLTVNGDLVVDGVVRGGHPWFMAGHTGDWQNCSSGWDNYPNFNATVGGNAGNWFDPSTGRFTAPESGVYLCQTNLYNHRRGVGSAGYYQHFSYSCGNGIGDWCDITQDKSATHDIFGYGGNQGSNGTLNSTNMTSFVYLPEGAWIEPRMYCSGTMSFFYGGHSRFGCALVSAD